MQCVKLKAKVIRVIEGNEFLIRGDAGSRTRVRKCFRTSVYVCSRSFVLTAADDERQPAAAVSRPDVARRTIGRSGAPSLVGLQCLRATAGSLQEPSLPGY